MTRGVGGTRRLALAALVATVVGGIAFAGGAIGAGGPGLRVDLKQRVSDDDLVREQGKQSRVYQAEPQLAIDPGNPSHLLGAAQEGRITTGGALANAFYYSGDSGRTWDVGLVPGITEASGGNFPRVSDPVAALGRGGRAYYASLALDLEGGPVISILLSRSSDGGRTWGKPVRVATSFGNPGLDEEWLAVDNATRSRHNGSIYIAYRVVGRSDPIFFIRSTNNGNDFSRPVRISRGFDSTVSPLVLVGPKGEVYVVYGNDGSRNPRIRSLRISRSLDGGKTFAKPVTISTYRKGGAADVRDPVNLSAAIEPKTGALHVGWIAETPDDPGDVFTARSLDRGSHWSRPLRVPDGPRRLAQFNPAISASGAYAGVLFHSQTSPGGRVFTVDLARSADRGKSFRSRAHLSPPFDIQNATTSDRGRFLGDYVGLASSGRTFHALWVDSREKPSFQGASGGSDVYAARIR